MIWLRWTRQMYCFWVVAIIMLLAGEAHAHLVSTELGPFYDGATHAFVSPEDLLTILGFAILAAYAGRSYGRRLLVTLTVAWAAGVLAGFVLAKTQWEMPLATAAMILLLGAAGALRVRVPAYVLAPAAGIVGVTHGILNGSAVHAAGGRWLTAAGVAIGVFVLVALLTGSSTWLEKKRAAVVLRVLASWVAAIGLLMLGWQFRA